MFTAVVAATDESGLVYEDTVVIEHPAGAYSVTKTARVCFDQDCTPQQVDCCQSGRPATLTLRYTGDDCSSSNNSQDPGKWECNELAPGPLPDDVFIVVSKKSCASGVSANSTYLTGDVSVGDEIVVDAADVGRNELDANTFICIYDGEDGTLLQDVQIHTSCSTPLNIGDQFGAWVVVDCSAPGEVEGDCCADGHPSVLTMLYTGDDCGATSHSQAPDKVHCTDLTMDPLPDTAYILSTDNEDPYHAGARVWFAGDVSVGGTYDIDAANAAAAPDIGLGGGALGTGFGSGPGGSPRDLGAIRGDRAPVAVSRPTLENTTYIHIFDTEGGTLLQTVEFHTSCSQPLSEGDQFGASQIVGCVGENEPVEGNCCSQGDLVQISLEYTGADCASSMNSQPDKFECDQYVKGQLPDTVYIVAAKKSCASGVSANSIYFEGEISVGESLLIDAADVNQDKLASNTFICIYDQEDGTLLQEVKIHTSCSAPLVAGDTFGAWTLTGCVGENGPVITVPPCDPFPDDGLFTYCYTVTNNGDSPLDIIQYEVLLDVAGVMEASYINDGGVVPSDVVITSNRVQWRFFDPPIHPGETSAKLYITSPLGPDVVPVSISGAGGLDTPSENVGPVVVCDFCQFGGDCFSCPDGLAAGPPCPLPPDDCCDAGNPRTLTLEYVAEGCEATNNQQGDKDDCDDFSGGVLPNSVYIVASKNSDCMGDIYYSGTVSAGDQFLVDAAAIGLTKFSSNTYFCIYDAPGGTLLQAIKIHTSCSAPLATNDQYGSLVLQGCQGENE